MPQGSTRAGTPPAPARPGGDHVRPQSRGDVHRRAGRAPAAPALGAGRPAARGGRGAGQAAEGGRGRRRRRRDARRPARPAVHHQAGPLGQLPVRHAGRAPGPGRRGARLQRHAGTPDARLLHQGRPRPVGGHVRAFAGVRGRGARQHRPQRLRLRTVHRRHRHPSGGGGARRDRRPDVGRHDRPADPDAHRPGGGRPDLHPRLRSAPRRGPRRGGRRTARAEGRAVRRRTLVGGAARRHRARPADQGDGRLRPLRGHRPRRRHRMPGTGRPARQRGPLHRRGRRPRDRRPRRGRHARRAGVHDADRSRPCPCCATGRATSPP